MRRFSLALALAAGAVLLPLPPAIASVAPSQECLIGGGGSPVAYGWLGGRDGVFFQTSYLVVSETETWLCARVRVGDESSTTNAQGLKLVIRTDADILPPGIPGLPTVDDNTAACDNGSTLASGSLIFLAEYKLSYITSSSDASICLSLFSGATRIRIHAGVPEAEIPPIDLPSPEDFVAEERDSYPLSTFTPAEVSTPARGSASSECDRHPDEYFRNHGYVDVVTLGQNLWIADRGTLLNGFCYRAGLSGGRVDVSWPQGRPAASVTPSPSQETFDRCNRTVASSGAPIFYEIKYESAPGPDERQHVCVRTGAASVAGYVVAPRSPFPPPTVSPVLDA